jgi:hypothetical protein
LQAVGAHPNVVEVLEVIEQNSLLFIVMAGGCSALLDIVKVEVGVDLDTAWKIGRGLVSVRRFLCTHIFLPTVVHHFCKMLFLAALSRIPGDVSQFVCPSHASCITLILSCHLLPCAYGRRS